MALSGKIPQATPLREEVKSAEQLKIEQLSTEESRRPGSAYTALAQEQYRLGFSLTAQTSAQIAYIHLLKKIHAHRQAQALALLQTKDNNEQTFIDHLFPIVSQSGRNHDAAALYALVSSGILSDELYNKVTEFKWINTHLPGRHFYDPKKRLLDYLQQTYVNQPETLHNLYQTILDPLNPDPLTKFFRVPRNSSWTPSLATSWIPSIMTQTVLPCSNERGTLLDIQKHDKILVEKIANKNKKDGP